MNPSLPNAMAHQDLATHYEQLRRHALMGTSSNTTSPTLVLLEGILLISRPEATP